MLTGVHYNTAGARVASSVTKAPSAPKVSSALGHFQLKRHLLLSDGFGFVCAVLLVA